MEILTLKPLTAVEMKYFTLAEAEAVKQKFDYLVGGTFCISDDHDHARLLGIRIDPSSYRIQVNNKIQMGYYCLFVFDTHGPLAPYLFTHYNQLPDIIAPHDTIDDL
jgi:hypothetical protein